MLIQPQYICLSDLLTKRLFRIPEYQRAYSWQRKQREDLFADIDRIKGDETDRTHFMATMVGLRREKKRIVTDEYQVIDVVDGQQRLTTLIILQKAISKALDPGRSVEKKLAGEIEELLVKPDDHSLLLLQTNHDSSHYFADYLRKGEHPPIKNAVTLADRALLEGIEECEAYVKGWNAGGPGKLLELAAILKNRLTFILHEIQDEAAVYTVFEVLNSRGLPVPWVDRMKSTLMAIAFEAKSGNEVETIKELHHIWRDIYACIGLRQGMSTEALRFAATLRSEEAPRRVLSEIDAVEELRTYCKGDAARALETSKWILEVARAVDGLLKDRRRSAITKIVHARFLAVAIHLRQLPEPQTESLLREWERVTFRIFGLCAKDSRTKVGDYVRLAWSVLRKKSPVETVAKEVHAIGDDYPIKDAVRELENTDCYQGWQEELRYFLFRYEEHLAHLNGQKYKNEQWQRIWEDSPSSSIEHIFPQSKGVEERHRTKVFVHRLGNLVLLEPGLNSKLSNSDPQSKAAAYVGTGMFVARDVVPHLKKWDRAAVEKRERQLIEWAQKEWGESRS